MQDRQYFVYLLASAPRGTLYVGVTNDIIRRITEHKDGNVPGFTRKYAIKILVWFEEHGDIYNAIAREKRLKRWRRDWKCTLIEEGNPHWTDLYPALIGRGSRVSGPVDRSPGMTGEG
jgi:putative endonuclease